MELSGDQEETVAWARVELDDFSVVPMHEQSIYCKVLGYHGLSPSFGGL